MRDWITIWTATVALPPLLCAAGTAATAAGVYYMIKKRGQRRTEHTSVLQDCLGHTDTLMHFGSTCDVGDVEVVNFAPTDSVELEDFEAECHNYLAMNGGHVEAKEQLKVLLKHAMKTREKLENKKLALVYKVHKLEGRVQQLEEMLYEVDLTCGAIKQDCKQAWKAYAILKSEYEKTFKEPPTVSVDEAEKKHEPEMESRALFGE